MTPGRGDEVVELPTGQAPLHARATRVDVPAVHRLLDIGDHPLVWWHPPSGPAIASADAVASISTAGPDRFERVRDWAETVGERIIFDGPPAARPRFLGGFAFDDATSTSAQWQAFPPAWFVLPAQQLVRTDEGTWLTAIGTDDPPSLDSVVDRLETAEQGSIDDGALSPLDDQHPVPDREQWLDDVRAIQQNIADGPLQKAVLGHTIRATLAPSPTPGDLGRRLRSLHPHCYRFVIAPEPGHRFLGASPERLVDSAGRQLRTDALAGSRRRGDGPETDRELAVSLQESSKEAFEHEVVVDAIRDRLDECCRDVSTGTRSIRQLASVQHLHTAIEATRPAGCHLLDVAAALHPTPAVGGLPRESALATLSRLEGFDRGWYAAPIGWFDREGNGQFAIGIRSAAVTEDEATLFAGAGIVAESDPAAEWNELQLKYQPIRSTFRER